MQAIPIAGIIGIGATFALTSLRLPVICPLRLLTGVPCPLCGMTTGTVSLVRGDLAGAATANPFSLAFAPGLLWHAGRTIRQIFAPRALPRVSLFTARWAAILVSLAAVISWLFQLVRFHIV